MQTNFSLAALADPNMRSSEKVIRSCVHCGFCTATCPTYLLLGDELDSPRGRIYLIKDMLENERTPGPDVVKHVDRCLSCLSCMTTCPSGVNYMHLVDHARAYIEDRYRRPFADRALRAILARLLPSRAAFRAALFAGRIGRPFAPLIARLPLIGARLAAMLALAPARQGGTSAPDGEFKGAGAKARARVALLRGCAQDVLAPDINAAAIRLLNRAGVDVVMAPGEGCCGALVHHMGKEDRALQQARVNIDVWTREIETKGLDAIVIAASGCGTTIKDYGFMFRDDPLYAEKAARVSALAKDITEYLVTLDLPFGAPSGRIVAYHSACSLRHGQKILDQPKALLRRAGFTVREPAEAHICCGSAGTYNILQPEIAAQLRDRKAANIARLKPDIIAAGNIGCLTQIGLATSIPLVHTVELLDWASGGPAPRGFEGGLA